MSTLKEKLTELKELLDMGLIDEAEFAGEKKALLATWRKPASGVPSMA